MKLKREHKLKIISVILATTLWYFVVWGKPVEKVIEVPLFYRINKPGYLIEINPRSILVKLSGTRNSFRKLSEKFLQITLDLSQYLPVQSEKTYRIRVPIEALHLPPEIKLKEVTPRYVSVIIKKLSIKKIPVKVKFTGKPEGFKVSIIPAEVIVKGPVTLLKRLKYLETEPVNLFLLKKKKQVKVRLISPPDLISVFPEKVKILLKNEREKKK